MTAGSWWQALDALHFLRPQWLWALLALPLLALWWRARRRRANAWRASVDPHLLPHLLDRRAPARSLLGAGIAALAFVLAVLALAGPSWQRVEQPLWQTRTPLVVALDLSSATLAGDLPPSRLAQAKAELDALLREREGGQVGLVAYAGEAFTVAPLTADARNVALFLDALHPDVMPVDGQRADRAIEWSARLLERAGFDRGEILLMTDHADAPAREAAAAARAAGYRVSVLGLGSEAGAPYRGVDGQIGQARLDPASLRRIATAGGGRYVPLQAGPEDLQALGVLDPSADAGATAGDEHARVWQDGGYWLLPPLMLLALFGFRRRGGVAAVLLLCAWLPLQPAHAGIWQRPDQLAHEQMAQAAQAYRQGDYARAAQLYGELAGADAHYNRGNALAKAGRYPQAIEAYERALQLQPGMEDAIANKRAVEAAMKRKQKEQGNQGDKDSGQPAPCQPGDPNCVGPSDQENRPAKSRPSESGAQNGKSKDRSEQAAAQQPSEAAPSPSEPADAQAQAEADRAQRERMQRALAKAAGQEKGEQGTEQAPANETAEQRERRLANEAWLNRVPDDPGGLLREKFRLEHQRRRMQGGPEE